MGNHTSMRARGRSGRAVTGIDPTTGQRLSPPSEARTLNQGASKWRNIWARAVASMELNAGYRMWNQEHGVRWPEDTIPRRYAYQQHLLHYLTSGLGPGPASPKNEQERADYRAIIATYKAIRDDALDAALTRQDEQSHLEPGTSEALLNRGFVVKSIYLPGSPTARDEAHGWPSILGIQRLDGQPFRGANATIHTPSFAPSTRGQVQAADARFGDPHDVVFFSYLADAHPNVISPLGREGRAALAANHAADRARGHEVKTYEDALHWHEKDAELRPYYAAFGKQYPTVPGQ